MRTKRPSFLSVKLFVVYNNIFNYENGRDIDSVFFILLFTYIKKQTFIFTFYEQNIFSLVILLYKLTVFEILKYPPF